MVGPDASPVTLSDSENLFAFVNWPGYVAVNMGAAGTNTNWPARYAALWQLSQVTDPAAFAAAAAHTQFAPVDVFILTARAGRWTWQPGMSFSPAQFSPAAFAVFTGLPGDTVVAVRKPTGAAAGPVAGPGAGARAVSALMSPRSSRSAAAAAGRFLPTYLLTTLPPGR